MIINYYICPNYVNYKQRIMKRSNLLLCLFLGFFSVLFAQQESQYTQYMYNTMAFNPAYTGSREEGSFFGMHRQQWVGFPGAPKTSIISYHQPIKSKNIGLGGAIFHEAIGPINQVSLMGDFAYTLDMEQSKLAFGLQVSFDFYDFDITKLNLRHPNDPSIAEIQNRVIPNVGTGAYWYSDHYYFGVSVPRLLQSNVFDLLKEDRTIQYTAVKNVQHFYLMGGYVFDINENVKFKPAALVKLVQGSPAQFDLSGNFMFNDKFVLGLAHRWGGLKSAAVSALAGVQFNERWFLGYAFDFETTEIQRYSYGSHEIFLRYELIPVRKRIISPRFF